MGALRWGVVLLGCSAALAAADSFAGTWKLNRGKSVFQSGRPPQDQTIAIQQRGDTYDVKITSPGADGSSTVAHYTVPIASGKGAVLESSTYDAVSSKRINSHARENTYFIGGKKVMVARAVLSRDGKTMRVAMRGIGALGQRLQGVAVFQRE